MTATRSAVGYDVVLAIAPESYHITEDAKGRAYAFAMDHDTKRHLVECVRASLTDSAIVEDVVIAGGYLRVKLDLTRTGSPAPLAEYLSELRDVGAVYNERHATPGLEELHLGDRHVSTYAPEAGPTPEVFIDTLGDERLPDTEGPVYRHTRDPGDREADPDRHLAFRVIVPIDPSIYADHGEDAPPYPFTWDDHTREKLRQLVEDVPAWPGGSASAIRRVEVHPGYVDVAYCWGAVNVTPRGLAGGFVRALEEFNYPRGVHPELSTKGRKIPTPRLKLASPVYVGAVAPDEHTVDAWIRHHGLEAVDGTPVEPEPEGAPADSEENGGLLGRFKN